MYESVLFQYSSTGVNYDCQQIIYEKRVGLQSRKMSALKKIEQVIRIDKNRSEKLKIVS